MRRGTHVVQVVGRLPDGRVVVGVFAVFEAPEPEARTAAILPPAVPTAPARLPRPARAPDPVLEELRAIAARQRQERSELATIPPEAA